MYLSYCPKVFSCPLFIMNSDQCNWKWVILSWNIRGINHADKWDGVRSKILEAKCDILCLQETKREYFDNAYIKKICPPSFPGLEALGAL